MSRAGKKTVNNGCGRETMCPGGADQSSVYKGYRKQPGYIWGIKETFTK